MDAATPPMSMAEYLAAPGISSSQLRHFATHQPIEHKAWIENPTGPTDSMRLGTAIHVALLEPDRFDPGLPTSALAVWPKRRVKTKEGDPTKAWLEFQAEAAERGQEVVTGVDWEKAQAVAERVRNCVDLSMLDGAVIEEPIFWADPVTFRPLKAKLDARTDKYVIDLKSTSKPLAQIQSAVDDYLYDLQAAMYQQAATTVDGVERDFYFLFVRSSANDDWRMSGKEPAVWCRLDPEWLEAGARRMRDALDGLDRCMRTNTWPGVARLETPWTLRRPTWADERDSDESYHYGL